MNKADSMVMMPCTALSDISFSGGCGALHMRMQIAFPQAQRQGGEGGGGKGGTPLWTQGKAPAALASTSGGMSGERTKT